jgi:hypothetical protein
MSETLKNSSISNLGEYQMINQSYDNSKDAFRVTVVDGLTIKADSITIPEMKFPEMTPVIIKEQVITEVKVPEIIKEIQVERIEIPVIIKEVQIIEVEKPIIVPEIRIIEIEKPVIVKEIQIQVIEKTISQVPKIVIACMIVQALALLGILLTKAM